MCLHLKSQPLPNSVFKYNVLLLDQTSNWLGEVKIVKGINSTNPKTDNSQENVVRLV